MSILSDRIREYRIKAGLSQDRVAELIGISGAQYQNYEYGKSEPTAGKLKNICEVLRVSAGYLLGQTDNTEETIPRWGAERILFNIRRACFYRNIEFEQAFINCETGAAIKEKLEAGNVPPYEMMIPLATYLDVDIETLTGIDINGNPVPPHTEDEAVKGINDLLIKKGLMRVDGSMDPDVRKELFAYLDLWLETYKKAVSRKQS